MSPCPRCAGQLPERATYCPRCGAPAPGVTALGHTEPDTRSRPGAPRAGQTAVLAQLGAPPPPRLLGEGTMVGPYRIDGVLGEGGMSAVYAATDTTLGREVALKALHPFLLGDAGIGARFRREGRIGRGWSHPHVGSVFDVVDTGDVLALVMERIEGDTLTELIASWQGGLPLPEMMQVAHGVVDALQAAHARGIVHRDVKPGNVMVEVHDGQLRPRVIDFGIARVLEGTTYTLSGAVMGTCRYMAPEQVRGESVGPEADVYALGAVLYEVATGRPPFSEENPFALMMAHATQPVPPPRTHRPDLPEGLEALILEMMRKPAADRPGLDVVATRLEAIAPRSVRPRHVTGGPGPNGHVLQAIAGGPFAYGPTRRQVHLDPFAIDRFPVTNRQYQVFLQATGYTPDDPRSFLRHWRRGPPKAQLDHPVVFVDHRDATAYAAWLGMRLPTEAEWEKAARGTDGRRYPWGRRHPTPERANYGRRHDGTTPVSAHPDGRSPYGVEDLAGNVWEWTADADADDFVTHGPITNPRRPVQAHGGAAVVRGGCWWLDDPKSMRTTARQAYPRSERSHLIGFRCVR